MFRAQVSQIVLSAHFTILRLITIVWAKTWKISYLRKFSSKVTQIVSQLICPFYGLLQLYDLKFQKSNICVSAVHKYHKSCLSSFDIFRLITTVRGKTSKISYLREFSAQVSQIVFSAYLTVLRLYYNCMKKNFKNLMSQWV